MAWAAWLAWVAKPPTLPGAPGKSMEDLKSQIERVRRENPGVRIDCYVLFESHTDAMELYELARSIGCEARISTTPRQARSSCGVALLINCDHATTVEEAAIEHGVSFESIVVLPNQINPKRDVYC